jgi:hypothetical protein
MDIYSDVEMERGKRTKNCSQWGRVLARDVDHHLVMAGRESVDLVVLR